MHVVNPSFVLGLLALCLVVFFVLAKKKSVRPSGKLPPPLPGKTRGRVKEFSQIRGYGRIQPLDNSDTSVYVHISAVERAGFTRLYEGDIVDYVLLPARSGKLCAEKLDLIRRDLRQPHSRA
jgi:CspA family cold shock protein